MIRLVRVPPADGQPAQYQFSDFERRTPLIAFALIFAAVVIAVARWRGFASLIGLGFAAFILVKFMFPALVAGTNPIAVGLIGSSAIMFVVLYAAHGFSARTTTALVGTLFGLILIAALGYVATRWAHLTGVASEEDFVLAAAAPDLRLTSVVLCGIIVAGLGVLNDVTITQASAVWELADADSRGGKGGRQSQRHIFTRAMRIGRDHIASTVYTIVFATAGASLSVLLLIAIYDRPLFQVLQTEQFAGEVVRILVGSIGLVLAVPLTTAVGAAVVRVSGSGTPVGDSRSERAAATTGSASGDEDTTVLPKTKWRDLGQSATEPAADFLGTRRPSRPRRAAAGARDGATMMTTSATSPTCTSRVTPIQVPGTTRAPAAAVRSRTAVRRRIPGSPAPRHWARPGAGPRPCPGLPGSAPAGLRSGSRVVARCHRAECRR